MDACDPTISKLLGLNILGQKSSFSNSDLDLLEASLERSSPARICQSSTDCILSMKHPLLSPSDIEAITSTPQPPAATRVIAAIKAPEGGTLVSIRKSDGRLQMRIEYSREQLLNVAKSPLTLLPPASIKEMVSQMPEILASFPTRHGVATTTTTTCTTTD